MRVDAYMRGRVGDEDGRGEMINVLAFCVFSQFLLFSFLLFLLSHLTQTALSQSAHSLFSLFFLFFHFISLFLSPPLHSHPTSYPTPDTLTRARSRLRGMTVTAQVGDESRGRDEE
uniref:Transmembrane protein n=1 Tax=Palpitomonas bilix TaxID=652834 RepID=A0A7S3D4I6_9EUKA|mmetsp:Transcript_19486/g.49923  ORF Transcript_19486/g.49923 Transcript_19486/m.49923 type:complete len:116 (+) Transcript_19486:91-438(+)